MTRRAGYSLFEVLIAFAIMTMVLATLLPRQADMLSRAARIETRLDAQDAALSHLAALGLAEPLTLGQRALPVGDWQLTETIRPHVIAGVDRDIYEITVTVGPGLGPELARLTELRVAP